jgi:hypothetical protein
MMTPVKALSILDKTWRQHPLTFRPNQQMAGQFLANTGNNVSSGSDWPMSPVCAKRCGSQPLWCGIGVPEAP